MSGDDCSKPGGDPNDVIREEFSFLVTDFGFIEIRPRLSGYSSSNRFLRGHTGIQIGLDMEFGLELLIRIVDIQGDVNDKVWTRGPRTNSLHSACGQFGLPVPQSSEFKVERYTEAAFRTHARQFTNSLRELLLEMQRRGEVF